MTKRRPISETGLTEHERRILAYLDQHGPTHRSRLAQDLADPESNTARLQNGSNGAVPLIVGRWTARLTFSGLVRAYRERSYYRHHEITNAGRAMLRGDGS